MEGLVVVSACLARDAPRWRRNADALRAWNATTLVVARDGSCATAFVAVAATCVDAPPGTAGRNKFVHYRRLELPRAARHVWYADSDISFVGFELGRYASLWRRMGRPLLSQPVVTPSTQRMAALNHATWRADPALARVGCVASDFVEQQAFLLERAFADHLLRRALRPLIDAYDAHNCSWGVDYVWCGLARQKNSTCAILNVPIAHDDTRTLRKTGAFLAGCERAVTLSRRAHPRAFLDYSARRAYKHPRLFREHVLQHRVHACE